MVLGTDPFLALAPIADCTVTLQQNSSSGRLILCCVLTILIQFRTLAVVVDLQQCVKWSLSMPVNQPWRIWLKGLPWLGTRIQYNKNHRHTHRTKPYKYLMGYTVNQCCIISHYITNQWVEHYFYGCIACLFDEVTTGGCLSYVWDVGKYIDGFMQDCSKVTPLLMC